MCVCVREPSGGCIKSISFGLVPHVDEVASVAGWFMYVCRLPACHSCHTDDCEGCSLGGVASWGSWGRWGQHSWGPAARRLAYLSCQLALLLLLRALHSFAATCHLPRPVSV